MYNGSIPVSWNKDDFVNLEYRTYSTPIDNFRPLNDILYNHNINVYSCSDNLPESLLKVKEYFDLDKIVIAINKMIPGQILPYHTDLYNRYREQNSIIDIDNIMRIIVFLEDTKAGHQLWIEDSICIGKAGDFFGWRSDTKHMAANLGFQDRYVMQITGCKNNHD